MLFNSIQFLIFFPVVVGIYFATPHRYRWMWLLAASYYFYMAWKPEYIILIIASTLIDYYSAIQIEDAKSEIKKRLFLIISLCTNLGLLFTFKYFNFFNESIRTFFNSINVFYNVPALEVLLPVGISFYTFQTLSYTIDVYRGQRGSERHLGIFALYVSFFPQLVAGPIERSTKLIPQFYEKFDFDYDRVTSGLRRMAWGFFKKLVIADKAAIFVDQIYNNPTEYSGFPLIFATYLFAFQIYCDFSGYSDIAIGAARVMGFDLMENFKQPYLSRSIPEFWKRWHISLSTWFKDYVYIPLGGNRVSELWWYFNLMVVFLVSGLWHGANWTFVIWGGLHGVFMILTVLVKRQNARIGNAFRLPHLPFIKDFLQIAITFHLVVFAWIFFRANSLADAIYIITHLFTDFSLRLSGYGIGLGVLPTLILVFSVVFMGFVELIRNHKWVFYVRQLLWFRWASYYMLLMFIVLFGEFDSMAQFIYFQF